MDGICTMPFLISLFLSVLNGNLSEKENMLQTLKIVSRFNISTPACKSILDVCYGLHINNCYLCPNLSLKADFDRYYFYDKIFSLSIVIREFNTKVYKVVFLART